MPPNPYKSVARFRFTLVIGIALGILFPSVMLTYLGLRSYRIENALLKNQMRERYSAIGDLMTQQIESQFSGLLAFSQNVTASKEFQNWDVAAFSARLLNLKVIRDGPVKAAYVFDNEDKMVFPRVQETSLLYQPLEGDLDWGLYASEIQRLEQIEFEKKDMNEAIKGYETLHQKSLPPHLKAALLQIMAAVYHKAGQDPKAENAYLELINANGDRPDSRGQPLGVTARMLLARLYDETGRHDRADALSLELGEKIVYNQWPMAGAAKEKIMEEILKRKITSSDQFVRSQHLKDVRAAFRSCEKESAVFLEKTWPQAVIALRKRGVSESGIILTVDGRGAATHPDDLLLLIPIRVETGKIRGVLAAVIDGGPVWSSLKKSLDALGSSNGLTYQLTEKSEGEAHVWGAAPIYARQIDIVHPPRSLKIQTPKVSAEEEVFNRRSKTFATILSLSLLVAGAGVLVLIWAVRRELQVARLKAEFVANVSHEIRTPLYAISHIGERLDLGRYRSESEAKEFYAMLREETQRLRVLVENVLDFSKIMDGRKLYKLAPVDLAEVAREALRLFSPKAQAYDVVIHSDVSAQPLLIQADKSALVQATINLLDNALKHSGAKEITLRVSQEGNDAVLSVDDKGVGIPAGEHKRIFGKFYRLDSAAPRVQEGGVGLGLAIVKHIVESHGSRIALDSSPGRGSCFTLYFKLRA
jgi:signal transduction histidine kinase